MGWCGGAREGCSLSGRREGICRDVEGCVDAGVGVGGLGGGGAISCLVMALVLASAVLSCIGSLIIGGLC